jgi:hypothetical protein
MLESSKALKSLKKKGFEEKNTHHKILEYSLDGKFILHTRISHGANHDLSNYHVAQMAKQCKLSKKEFVDLVQCPLSKSDYEKKIRTLGLDK